MTPEISLTIITILLGIIGYFLKRTLDKVEVIGDDVAEMKPKVEILWKEKFSSSSSPRQLNERGEEILTTSGIREIIDEKRQKLINLVRAKNPSNPYDAEASIIEVMMAMPGHCPDMIDRLKQGAFLSGVDVDTVLFSGSVYLRNLIFKDLGFNLEDLDKPRGK